MLKFKKEFKELLNQLYVTQTNASKDLGIDNGLYSRLLSGKRTLSIYIVEKLISNNKFDHINPRDMFEVKRGRR